MQKQTVPVVNNEAEGRFEAKVDGETALLQYRREAEVIAFVHTEVPSGLEGRGVGGELVRAGLEYARSLKLRVLPLCSFAVGYIERHPEYQDLVAEEHQGKVRRQ